MLIVSRPKQGLDINGLNNMKNNFLFLLGVILFIYTFYKFQLYGGVICEILNLNKFNEVILRGLLTISSIVISVIIITIFDLFIKFYKK